MNLRSQVIIKIKQFLLSQANTQLITNAAETLTFSSIDQLDQGAGTLYTITSQLTKGGDVAKTMDMKGREAAVQLIEVGIEINSMIQR